ncbi:MAG: type II toxin-antitoxin system Phd/YefM family antitoxin [Planctomycetota bacterium]|nr:MAG: type II toxin-antitoxin system Phd/YefM family antitoxin [Planctomycetota bacterium]
MTTVKITEVRPQLRKLADKVCHHGERICVERNGEPVFVMVSYEDFEAIEALEERLDIQEAKKALKKGKFIPLERLEAELGL